MSLFSLFEQFLKEKQFLIGISPKTIRSYQQAFKAYQRVLSSQSTITSGEPGTAPNVTLPNLGPVISRDIRVLG